MVARTDETGRIHRWSGDCCMIFIVLKLATLFASSIRTPCGILRIVEGDYRPWLSFWHKNCGSKCDQVLGIHAVWTQLGDFPRHERVQIWQYIGHLGFELCAVIEVQPFYKAGCALSLLHNSFSLSLPHSTSREISYTQIRYGGPFDRHRSWPE